MTLVELITEHEEMKDDFKNLRTAYDLLIKRVEHTEKRLRALESWSGFDQVKEN